MKVYFVGSGPGAPDLLTVRALRLLESCKCCIYAGSLVSSEIVELIPDSAEKHDSAKLSLNEIVDICKNAQKDGVDVLRLHSGDPSIYGAIREQIWELNRYKIDSEVVPGVSSFQAAAAAIKAELTAPEISQTIVLTRTSGRTPMPEQQNLSTLAKTKATLCIFLSIHKLNEIADTLSVYYGDTCPAAVVYKVSRPEEKIVRGTLADIAEKVSAEGITKTAMIIVGHALSDSNTVSKLYDAGFSHEYRKAIK